MMKEERSPEEILELHELRRADPQRFLEVIDEWLQENPNNFRQIGRASCRERV